MRITHPLLFVACLGLGGLASGCRATVSSGIAKVAEAERTRSSLQGRDAQTLAPQAFADADQSLRAAKDASLSGDSAAAELHAERAVAAYQHAVALARLARATDDETQTREALSRALEQSQRYAAARKAAEREADDLEKQVKVAREAERPSGSGPADPQRERARLVAARSLATQARVLCSAARLVSPQAPGLAEAEASVLDLEKKLESAARPAPIDAAGRIRAACLTALTKARRSGAPETDQADALLGELSRARMSERSAKASSSAPALRRETDAELSPSRDERGVVVTLRSLFNGSTLSSEAEATLKELGRVAAAHPGFAIQVVIHDATPPTEAELARGAKRGEAIAKALTEGGASKTKVEHAGAHSPIFDPTDLKRREKNARVDVVFVNGS